MLRWDIGRRKGNEVKKENEGGSKHSDDLTVTISSSDLPERDNHRVRRVLASCDK
jgi:hypothetical protein